jgi:hypothetical protein
MEQANNQLTVDSDYPSAILGGGDFFLKNHTDQRIFILKKDNIQI